MSRQSRRKARNRRRSTGPMGIPPFALGVTVVVILGVVALVLAGGGDGGNDRAFTAPVEIRGDGLPEYTGEPDDPAAGEAAPELLGDTFDGTPINFTNAGTPRAVIFLAHWCPHCQTEVDELTAFVSAQELPSGVAIESVSTLVDAQRGNFPPDSWLRDAGWPFPVMADDAESSAAEAYGLGGTPFWTFVDAEGRVVERLSGQIPPAALASLLELLADGHTADDGPLTAALSG